MNIFLIMANKNEIISEQELEHTEDGLIFDPFNPLNKEITLNDVQCILKRYGLPPKVNNLNLYKRAFVHTSYVKKPMTENINNNITIVPQPPNCLPLKTKSNERLEFLGDGILEAVTKFYLYRRFPKENEGFMTEKKIALVKNEAIGRLAYQMKLHQWVLISKHAEEKQIRANVKKLGCLFEAILGAVFLDFNKETINDEEEWFSSLFITGPGFQMAQVFIENIFEKHVDWDEIINNDNNFKNIFQVIIQKRFKITPDYIELDNNDETGYTMGVYIALGAPVYSFDKNKAICYSNFTSLDDLEAYYLEKGNVLIFMAKGTHKTKKKAEQIACEKAITLLNS
ncbi:MAG: ribonuclease III family protein [Vampirovibrionia bacterium]|jgi:dsRNA-specific ribonuclease